MNTAITDPTAMVDLPVSFLVHPASVRLLPANAASQKRRADAWKTSTPAAASGARNWSNSTAVFASRAS